MPVYWADTPSPFPFLEYALSEPGDAGQEEAGLLGEFFKDFLGNFLKHEAAAWRIVQL